MMQINNSYLTKLWRDNSAKWESLLSREIEKLGINYVDRLILTELASHSMLTKKDLAKHLCTIHQNLTRSIQRLERVNLIVLQKKSADKRQIYLCLTEKGKKTEQFINKKINDIWDKALDGFTEVQRGQLVDLLSVISCNLEKCK